MALTTDASDVSARQDWMGVLAQARADELEQTWRDAGSPAAAQWVRAAETGLVMVRGKAGGGGTRFNVGELTATRCACRIDGSDAIGYAITSGRNTRKAELAALIDAVLQSACDRAGLAAELIEPLRQAQTERRRSEAAKAAATRVDFFTMVRGE